MTYRIPLIPAVPSRRRAARFRFVNETSDCVRRKGYFGYFYRWVLLLVNFRFRTNREFTNWNFLKIIWICLNIFVFYLYVRNINGTCMHDFWCYVMLLKNCLINTVSVTFFFPVGQFNDVKMYFHWNQISRAIVRKKKRDKKLISKEEKIVDYFGYNLWWLIV